MVAEAPWRHRSSHGPRDRNGLDRRTTISDVSDALGLTKGTVSRALNDYPDISESTRARVRSAADRMGYRPLSHAQAIKTGRTRSIGLVIQMADHDAHRPFLAEFLAGISRGASAEGWTLTVATSTGEDDTIEVMSSLIADRKADGFILPRTELSDPRVAYLRQRNVPFVLFGRTEDTEGCAWFDILGEAAMGRAVERLYGQGHRRIGFVNGGSRYMYSRLRQTGFESAMNELGLTPAGILTDAVTAADGAAATKQLLDTDHPPTALVFAVEAAALGAYHAARAAGLQIGRDLSVISYDGLAEGAVADPQLTTFEVDFPQAGTRLAQLLIRSIRGEPPHDLRETVHARLREGRSDGPPPQRHQNTKTKP